MSDTFEPLAGGCTCGEIRYEVTAVPLIVHACHCRWCQRQTGGPHVINALYEAELIKLTAGEVEEIMTPSPSGEGQLIVRCPRCRVAIWSNYHFGGLKKHISFLRVGTLDNPDTMPPDVHIYVSTKMPWYVIPPGDYAVTNYYDRRATWSEASQARYQKLVSKVGAAGGMKR